METLFRTVSQEQKHKITPAVPPPHVLYKVKISFAIILKIVLYYIYLNMLYEYEYVMNISFLLN